MGSFEEAMYELGEAEELMRQVVRRIGYAKDEGVRTWDVENSAEELLQEIKDLQTTTELLWEKWEDQ
jgi:hypothetical protein